MRFSQGYALVVIMIASVLASCSPMVDARGHTTNLIDLKQVIPGQSRREDVSAVLGSPSTTSSYGDEIWYYVSMKKERLAMLEPEVAKQRVVAITFDEAGAVSTIEEFGKKDGKSVDFVSKQTPTEGQKLTVIDQLLGNIGRFNSPGRTPGAVGAGGR
jgi:outer membrane protein assembly factor BamE (lipoprotein component of BamABCDE complex)